jgi:hypothetical protein
VIDHRSKTKSVSSDRLFEGLMRLSLGLALTRDRFGLRGSQGNALYTGIHTPVK